MDNYEFNGDFTKNLLCLRLQLETLFDDAGNEDCLKFLDLVSNLSRKEKEIFFASINSLLEKILTKTDRQKSLEDIEDEKFEEALYMDLKKGFDDIEKGNFKVQSRFKVINGGKSKVNKKIINFHKFA